MQEPMDVHAVSDYDTASEDRLDEMDVDVRSVTMEVHWSAANESFQNIFMNNPFGHKCCLFNRLCSCDT